MQQCEQPWRHGKPLSSAAWARSNQQEVLSNKLDGGGPVSLHTSVFNRNGHIDNQLTFW